MPARLAWANTAAAPQLLAGPQRMSQASQVNQQKWQRLLTQSLPAHWIASQLLLLPSPADLRVSPLLQSQWSQGQAQGRNCYNYYTPHNYVCGCVATAMAQLMRYLQFPLEGIGIITNSIWVDNIRQTATTRGGDGLGGAYDWSRMPLVPASAAYSEDEWKMIGALCSDAGVAVQMQYSDAGSGTSLAAIALALPEVFGFADCLFFNGPDYLLPINANLQAALPVILGIIASGSDIGHAIVCDGYGYDEGSCYHHLNLGWAGSYDAYYNLPNIIEFDTIVGVISHIYTNQTGEIISGRISDSDGTPIANASIRLPLADDTVLQAYTSSQGYYGLCGVPSGTTNTIQVTATGYASNYLSGIVVGSSDPWHCGSVADADLILSKTQAVLSCSPTNLAQVTTNGASAPLDQSYEIWNSGSGTLDYQISHGAPWLALAPSDGSSTGQHDIIWVAYTNTESLAPRTYQTFITNAASGAMGSPKLVGVTLQVRAKLAPAIGQSDWIITSGGDAAWFGQGDTTPPDTNLAAQSGPIADEEQTWLQTTVEGPGTLSFYWKISSEPNFDYLRFYVDGTEKAAISGQTDWLYASHNIAPGEHTLRWNYTKDAAATAGADAAWVAKVAFRDSLPAPLGVTASVGSYTNKIRVNWQAVSGAENYLIYRSRTNASQTASQVAETAQTSYEDSAVQAGDSFYYWIQASNASARSDYSQSARGSCAPPRPARADLQIRDFLWQPARLAPAAHPDRVAFTLHNNGPDALVAEMVTYNFYLSRQPTFVAASATRIGGGSYKLSLAAGKSRELTLTAAQGAGLTIPAAASGLYYVFLWAQTAQLLDPQPGNNVARTAAITIEQGAAQRLIPLSGDFDGDGKTDLALYQPATGFWAIKLSQWDYGQVFPRLGGAGCQPLALDFDGDGLADPAIYEQATGNWQALLSGQNYALTTLPAFGGSDYLQVAADYDGDGRADPALYHVTSGLWLTLLSAHNYQLAWLEHCGGDGYCPVPADYDGDGRTDPAVYHLTSGRWEARCSSCAYQPIRASGWGGHSYRPVAGHYDQDRLADPAVYEARQGQWHAMFSAANYSRNSLPYFGGPGYEPVTGDFDGDGQVDPALYHAASATWFIKLSGDHYNTHQARQP
ncbi:MAG: hypothetical protein GX806_06950 [Lentisphaerae bacterium]|nr:hypothetical protein [Lentisphaerota bacterium]